MFPLAYRMHVLTPSTVTLSHTFNLLPTATSRLTNVNLSTTANTVSCPKKVPQSLCCLFNHLPSASWPCENEVSRLTHRTNKRQQTTIKSTP